MAESERDSVEYSRKIREIEAIAKAAGVSLDLSKSSFMLSRETIMKLISGVAQNEFVRATNNHICLGCDDKMKAGVRRGYDHPDAVWDFCKEKRCPHLKIIKHVR